MTRFSCRAVLAAATLGLSSCMVSAEPPAILRAGTAQPAGATAIKPPALGAFPIKNLETCVFGTTAGLFRREKSGDITTLWSGGEVRKIVRTANAWYALSDKGILRSLDLAVFEPRNAGLPFKTIKRFSGGKKYFVKELQELKDLEYDPYDPESLVTCTKDAIYSSADGGLSWASVPSPVPTSGLKAVAICSRPEPLLFAAHPIKGTFVRRTGVAKPSWLEIGGDLARASPGASPDELSDILVEAAPDGPRVWAANSFLPRIYRYDFATRKFAVVLTGQSDFATFESLAPTPSGIAYVCEGTIRTFVPSEGASREEPDLRDAVRYLAAAAGGRQVTAMAIRTADGGTLCLSELWLVDHARENPRKAIAENHSGIYLQTGFVVKPESRAKYDGIMADRGLDLVVVDLKDDNGRLRFEPRTELVRNMGRAVSPLDIEGFVAEMKAKGRYLVARIVVFKDKSLYSWSDGAYAAWDSRENKPWRGYSVREKEPAASAPAVQPAMAAVAGAPAQPPATAAARKEYERSYTEEYWLDPYCEKVWEYNVAIANEIIARGFDEVQFDYIRFPTDGTNLGDASYRYRESGMDMESALMSFLSYARENISAPIGIDIYGANGWYRSGVRTGQDVELLSRYVDVISPMFYPSHFEQDFMAFPPENLRPYRIYRIGTMRTSHIARRKVVVRPYVQAFFLNVAYDRAWYSPEYVRLETQGIRDAMDDGLIYWNNSGRYEDLPRLPLDDAATEPEIAPGVPD